MLIAVEAIQSIRLMKIKLLLEKIKVNISTCKIENKFTFSNMGNVNFFTRLRDGKIICGCENKGMFYVYDVERKSFRLIKDNNINKINDLVSINDEIVISCSDDGTIRVWMY